MLLAYVNIHICRCEEKELHCIVSNEETALEGIESAETFLSKEFRRIQIKLNSYGPAQQIQR